MKSDKMAKKTTLVGCVSEKDGKYLLTNTQYPNGIELSSSTDLKPHVGHQIKVTGAIDKAPVMAADLKSGDTVKSDTVSKTDTAVKSDTTKSDNTMKSDDTVKSDTLKSDTAKSDAVAATTVTADDKMANGDMPMMIVTVSSMKMVADHCPADKMSTK